MAQMVKNLRAVRETQVQSLGWEDALEKGMLTHSSILPGEFHGQKSLVGYCPWGWKESDTTEWPTLLHSLDSSQLVFPECSVHFSCLVVSSSLQPLGLQHARPPCPSPTQCFLTEFYSDSLWYYYHHTGKSTKLTMEGNVIAFLKTDVLLVLCTFIFIFSMGSIKLTIQSGFFKVRFPHTEYMFWLL